MVTIRCQGLCLFKGVSVLRPLTRFSATVRRKWVREHLESLTSLLATVLGRYPSGVLSTTNFVPDKIVIKYFLPLDSFTGIIRDSLILLCKLWSMRFAYSGHIVSNISRIEYLS